MSCVERWTDGEAVERCRMTGGQKGPRLTPESDPDVQSAVQGVPPGARAPVLLKRVRPVLPRRYPIGTRRMVILEGVITTDGRVKVVGVRGGRDPAFAAACVSAVRRSRYAPAKTRGGMLVGIRTTFCCTLVTKAKPRRRPTMR